MKRKVWVVVDTSYEPEDMTPLAVCSSHEQAVAVAASFPDAEAHAQPVELWEPDDGIPPWTTFYTCVVRDGGWFYAPGDMEAGRPARPGSERAEFYEVQRSLDNAPKQEVRVTGCPPTSVYVWAGGFPTREAAEAAAREAYRKAKT